MAAVHKPSSPAELCEAVRDTAAAGRTLEVIGAGSRRAFGRPTHAEAVLDLGAFAGVSVYEPAELVLTCGPATPMSELETLLARNDQQFAFEPPDLGPLWGQPAGQGTLGGELSTGLGGSRRIIAGGPRDHFLGFKAVNGYGEAFAAGGRVVKNVTGYDLPKLMAGAFGTLGAMTEVTVKVLPRAEALQTLAVMGLAEAVGLRALIDAMSGPYQVTAAAYLPDGLPDDDRSATLIRLELIPATVAASTAELTAALKIGRVEMRHLDAEYSVRLWRALGGGAAFADSNLPVWRMSVPPATAPAVGDALRRAGMGRLYFDWGGGAIWVEGTEGSDGGAAAIRGIVRTIAGGGHATLLRGSAELRATVDPFEPMERVLAELTARVKKQFDAGGVFNAGRMYRGV